MNQAVMLINCYLYGATAVMLLVLVLIVYLRGQMNHFPNPFAKKNLVYRHPAQAKGILFGKKFGLLAYSPEQDEGHILVLGPSGTGKTSALLIPTLRSWQGTALVVDISGDISANVNTPNKIVFDPTAENCIERICNIISVHRNHPPVARPVNPSAIRFLVCGLCCGCVVSAC